VSSGQRDMSVAGVPQEVQLGALSSSEVPQFMQYMAGPVHGTAMVDRLGIKGFLLPTPTAVDDSALFVGAQGGVAACCAAVEGSPDPLWVTRLGQAQRPDPALTDRSRAQRPASRTPRPSAVSWLICVPRPHIVHVVTYFVPRGMTGMKNKVKYLRILVRA